MRCAGGMGGVSSNQINRYKVKAANSVVFLPKLDTTFIIKYLLFISEELDIFIRKVVYLFIEIYSQLD